MIDQQTAPPLCVDRHEAAAMMRMSVRHFLKLVKAGKVIETSEGKVLGIREQTFETLSKKSVLEALGPVAGERELKRLRAKGAIRESTLEMLVGEK